MYGKAVRKAIENAWCVGSFSPEEATIRDMRLVTGESGSIKIGNIAKLYLLVDETDGIISDAKFQVFGEPLLIAAMEAVAELLLHKTYVQGGRLTADLLDRHLRDIRDVPSFPKEGVSFLNLALEAMDEALTLCRDIPFTEQYQTTPLEDIGESTPYPGWRALSVEEKIAVVEEVIASDIRPYIELDAGGVDILNLNGLELIIRYRGACTSCHSSTGSTLSAIQEILRKKVDPEIVVVPDLIGS